MGFPSKTGFDMARPAKPAAHAPMAEWACAYVRMGFHLCLLRPKQKIPMLAAWNDPHRVLDTEEKVRAALLANPACGIGLVHATSRTATLDVDHVDFTRLAFAQFGIEFDALLAAFPRIKSREGRDKILMRLPEGFVPGAEGVPTKTVLRWPDPATGEMVTVLELRGGINQDVLAPSIHPDTQQPYAWAEGQSPWDFEAVPEIDARLLTIWREWPRLGKQLEQACPWRPKMEDAPPPVMRATSRRNDSLIERFNADRDVAQMLAGYGYKRIGARWLAPSSKTKLPGVVVLEGKVYSHHGSDVLNNGHANDAFDVFMLLEHGGDFTRAIRAIAKEYREQDAPPTPADVSGFMQKLGSTKDEQVERLKELAAQPELSRVDDAGLRVVPFPVAGLEALARWFDVAFDETHPLVSQAAVLALIGTAAGRRYASQYGDGTGLYLGLMTPPGGMARYTTIGCNQVLMAAGLRHMVRGTRLGSPQQLYSLLWNRPAALYLAEDYGDQVRIARRQPSGLLEQTLSLVTGAVASGADLLLDNWQEIGLKHTDGDGNPQPTIRMPALCMLATIAGNQVGKVFGPLEVSRGSIDGMLFVPASNPDHWHARPALHAPPAPPVEAVERLRAMRGFEPGQTSMTAAQMDAEIGGSQATPVTVRFTGDVQAVEAAWITKYKGQGPAIRAMVAAARSRLRRICTAMAAFANPKAPVADMAIVAWAAGWVGYGLEQTIVEAELRATADDDRPDVYQQVLEFIGEAGSDGRAKRSLISGCRAFRSLSDDKRAELITQLHGDEQIHTLPTKSGRGKVYVHARFVKVLTENATADDVLTNAVSTSNTRQQSDAAQVLTADSGSPSLLEDRHSVYVSTSARQHFDETQ